MPSRILTPILLVLLLGFLPSGCGYHLRPAGEPIGLSVESIAIPLMSSTSATMGFESDFTSMVRDQFISHAKVPLLPTEEARYLLVGHIHDIRTDPESYTFSQQVVRGQTVTFEETNRRRLRLILDVSLVERATGKVVWKESAMQTRASFDIGTDPLVNQFNERLALERIARRLAERIYLMTMERF